MATLRQRYSVSDVTSEVFTAKFSPDGILLATGSNDGRVRIYDASLGTQRVVFDGMVADRAATGQPNPSPSALGSEGLPITSLRWRPQAFGGGAGQSQSRHVVLAVSADGSVRHWNAVTGKWLSTLIEIPLEELPGGITALPGRGVSSFGSSSKGSLTVSLGGSSTGTGAGSAAALKNALAGRMPHQIFACDFRPDGSLFATAGKDKAVRVYDEETMQCTVICAGGGSDGATPGHSNRVFALAWHPTEEHLLLSAGWDGTVQVQDIRAGHAVRGMYGAHVCGDALAWLPQGLPLAGGSTTGSGSLFVTGSWRQADAVQVWDYGSGRCVGGLHWWGRNEDASTWYDATTTARAGGKDGPSPPRDGGFVYALSVSKAAGGVGAGPGTATAAGAYLAAGGSGGNEVKVWRTATALAMSAAPTASASHAATAAATVGGRLHPVAGTLLSLSHAVYGLDWSDMVPAVLGDKGPNAPSHGVTGEGPVGADGVSTVTETAGGAAAGLSSAAAGRDPDSSTSKDITGDRAGAAAGLPSHPVPTLLVAGGEQPLRVFHLIDHRGVGLEPVLALGAGAAAAASAGGGKASSRPNSGAKGATGRSSRGSVASVSTPGGEDAGSEEAGWVWRDGDAKPPAPAEEEGGDAWTPAEGGATPTAADGAAAGGAGGLLPKGGKAGAAGASAAAAAAGQPRLPPSLRRGSAALRAVMDARLAQMGDGPASNSGLEAVSEEGPTSPGGAAGGSGTPAPAPPRASGAPGAGTPPPVDEAALLREYGGAEEEEEGAEGGESAEEPEA